MIVRLFLVLGALHGCESLIFSVFLVGLSDENHATKDSPNDYGEKPLPVFGHHKETQKTVQRSLDKLKLAIEAELSLISERRHTEKHECVVEHSLDPEGDKIDVLLGTEQIYHEKSPIDYSEACCKSGSTHIDLVLDAVKLAF